MGGSLLIQVWKDGASGVPLGMRWRSKLCHSTTSLDKDGVTVETITPKTRRPDWIPHVHEVKEQGQEQEQEQEANLEPERKSWWNRYSLYIMLFFIVALGQGIRQGLAELRKEMEREEEEKKRRNRPDSSQMRVMVPRRKESRARKRQPSSRTNSATS
ncbi:hypothetical protein FGB62_7g454 [Gracilaria domingensis]|nr:hypothetical protein FGB62_7g454 [Gracilaria domingensis]